MSNEQTLVKCHVPLASAEGESQPLDEAQMEPSLRGEQPGTEHQQPPDQGSPDSSSQHSYDDILGGYQDPEITAGASRSGSELEEYLSLCAPARTLPIDPLERFCATDTSDEPFCAIDREAMNERSILEAAAMSATAGAHLVSPGFGTSSSKAARDGSPYEHSRSEVIRSKHLRFRAHGAPLGFAAPQPRCPGSRSLP